MDLIQAYQNGIYQNELNAWAALELVKGCHLHPVMNELNAWAVVPQWSVWSRNGPTVHHFTSLGICCAPLNMFRDLEMCFQSS